MSWKRKGPVEVGFNDALIEAIRKKATPSCKKCHGAGFVGVLLKKDGGRSHLTCRCVTKNGFKLGENRGT